MSPQPEWISELANKVCRSIHLLDCDAPIGCHYHLSEEYHEISLFVSSTQVVGGSNDGHHLVAKFVVDVVEIMTILDFVDSASWQAQKIDQGDEIGPHFSITGIHDGEAVWIRVLGETPEAFLPGRLSYVSDQTFVNVWKS